MLNYFDNVLQVILEMNIINQDIWVIVNEPHLIIMIKLPD